jgi:plastocyanin
MIGLTVGSATVALAGCSGDGQESDDDVSESAENESDGELTGNDSAQNDDTATEEDTDGNETGDDAAAEPEANVVTVGPEESPTMFEPETLTVESGTTVTFEWATDTHNIVVESQPEDGNWDGQEEIQDAGSTHEHVFETEGEYEYICEPHAPDMLGVIVVGGGGAASENGTEDPTNSTSSSENGSAADDTQ